MSPSLYDLVRTSLSSMIRCPSGCAADDSPPLACPPLALPSVLPLCILATTPASRSRSPRPSGRARSTLARSRAKSSCSSTLPRSAARLRSIRPSSSCMRRTRRTASLSSAFPATSSKARSQVSQTDARFSQWMGPEVPGGEKSSDRRWLRERPSPSWLPTPAASPFASPLTRVLNGRYYARR